MLTALLTLDGISKKGGVLSSSTVHQYKCSVSSKIFGARASATLAADAHRDGADPFATLRRVQTECAEEIKSEPDNNKLWSAIATLLRCEPQLRELLRW